MEAGVIASSAVLDSIFDEAGLGLALLDRDMRYVRVNDALAEINGVPVDEHAGRPASDVLPEIPQAVAEASRRVLDTGEAVRGVEVDGPVDDAVGPRTFECSYHPLKDDGEVVGIWCSVREVTLDRRLAAAEQMLKEQLAEERRILEEVFTRAPVGLALLWGRQMRIRAFNTQILGNAPERGRLLNRPVAEAFPEIADLTAGAREAVLERGETLLFEEVGLPFGGPGAIDGRRYYTFSVVPVPGAGSGKPDGVLAVGQEVTDSVRRRRELEQELCEEHRIATELQVSLMPDRLPAVPGADVASGFRPAGDGHEIGGDFFDVFELADECWLLVIGDVCGKGAEAASLTALARYTLRAAAIQDGGDPVRLLARLNEALLRQRDDMRFLTCVCALLEPADGGALRLTVCVAGHPPPLKVDGGGGVSRVGPPGALIGAWEDPKLEAEVIELLPGERLVLYTDGVVEAGAPHHGLSEEGLVELLREAPGQSSAATVRAIEAAVAGGAGGPPRDDVAVLVLRADSDAEP